MEGVDGQQIAQFRLVKEDLGGRGEEETVHGGGVDGEQTFETFEVFVSESVVFHWPVDVDGWAEVLLVIY